MRGMDIGRDLWAASRSYEQSLADVQQENRDLSPTVARKLILPTT